MSNTIKALTIIAFLVLELLFISGNLAHGWSNNINKSMPSNANYTYSQLTPQVLNTGLQRIGGEGIENINNVDVDIAIMDVGIAAHPDLNISNRYNAVNPGTDYSVQCKHGTHVAGITAAKNDGGGIVGTAPGARIWDIRFAECDPTTGKPKLVADYSFLNALDYILEHLHEIDVVNISYNLECPAPFCGAQEYQDKIDRIVESGIIVVTSAGNNNDIAIKYVPPRLENVITVSAISDSDGKCGGLGEPTSQGGDDILASESNYGDSVDIAAPGIDILSTIPNEMYGTMSGTSMAAPYVSGTAAFIKANNASIGPDTVLSMIVNAGSNPQTECDGNGHGYFDDFKDNELPELHEPLLYIKDLISN